MCSLSREEIKYGINNPPQADNAIDNAIKVAERTIARAGDSSWLFDPALSGQMWERANEAVQEMRSQFGDFMADVWDGSVFLYYPGQSELRAYDSDIERFAYMLSYAGQKGCDIKLPPGGCSKGTVFLPLERGQFIVVFEICEACDEWARRTAETNFRVNVMEAQAGLPPGAVIDPGSPIAPRP